MADYRITQFPERTDVDSTDFVLMDSDNNGTNKFALARMQTAFNTAIDTETQARTAADEAMQDSIEQLETDMETALNTKANKNGTYPSMAVGSLLGAEVEDKVPYLYRPTGGGLSVGDREYDEIVGGTLGWNQLLPDELRTNTNNGITYIRAEKSPYILNGTATAQAVFVLNTGGQISAVAGHKFFMSGGKDTNVFVQLTTIAVWGGTNPRDKGGGTIANVAQSGSFDFALIVNSGTTVTDESVIPQLIDLTALFGSTIADYIYSLEQATTGAGVAWVRRYLTEEYYAYCAPTLKHVEGVSAHVMTGFNQWDEESVTNGYFNTSGGWITASTNLSSKNAIPVLPNTVYYVKAPANVYIHYFKTAVPSGASATEEYISRSAALQNTTFTTPANCHAIHFNASSAYGTTYNHDICINLHWDGERDGEYEPYVKHSYPLDSTWVGRGIPKLDSANKLYFDGDRYSADGTVTERYNPTDLGSLNWEKVSTGESPFFQAQLSVAYKYVSVQNNFICAKYIKASVDGSGDAVGIFMTDNNYIRIRDNTYADAASFKTAMSGTYLVYELATPTEETATPYEEAQICDPNGTEEYVTSGLVPVGHETEYPENLADKISDLPALPTAAGEYRLKVTVTGGKVSYTWVSA